ncbi:hypothetical protein JQ543_06315 [Bradyrhizobium diazoefficiens]|nr:hypothetical protein [Bradyrhizobium diazoefficiens]MBR0847350.1 hypothetical protein [Bradyrhizobium diazoefficiens]
MFEIGIFCVLVLAAGYWVAMYVMGRLDDVIHGKFVRAEEQGDFAQHVMPALPPPFPKRPVVAASVQPADEGRPVNSAALQSLLAAIQQDLKSVA